MKLGFDHLNALSLAFKDAAFENGFLNHFRAGHAEYIRIGYGFLVLFYMGIATAQVLWVTAPLYSNLVYAGLGLVALSAFSFLRPHSHYSPKILSGLAGLLVFGSGLAVFLPASIAALQVTAAVVTLMWSAIFSGLLFRQISLLLGMIFLPIFAIAAVVFWPLSALQMVAVSAIFFASVFAHLSSYAAERRLRTDFFYQYALSGSKSRHRDKNLQVWLDQGLLLLKELTAGLSNVQDVDKFYIGLLKYLKRVTSHDMVAIGRLKNERVMPVLMRSQNNDDISCEETVKLLWHNSLVQQLQKHKSPLVGQAEMGLLPSVLVNDDILFGYRMDIPFFAQGKLDGVVTLLRSQPAFSDADAALAASVVFHGLFAHRAGRLQKLEARKLARTVRPAVSRDEGQCKVLSVEEFLEQANVVFLQAQFDRQPLTLLLVEIDKYGQIEKRFGAQINKRIFGFLARVLTENAVSNSILGRYGSSSFAMQLPLALPQAKRLAEKLCEIIKRQPYRIGNHTINLTVSIGVSARDSSSPDFLSLVRGADIGLYLAREEQGNSVRVSH